MLIDPDLLGLEDAVALVTGGARSIGRGCAVQLASKLSSYLTGHPIPCHGGILHTTSRPPIGMTMVPAALAGMVGDRRISREAD